MNAPARTVSVDICICTFRRPQITDTLASLERLILPPGCRVAVIVADNDDTPSARARVERWALASRFVVTYIHCPDGNISIARNGCLEACTRDFAAAAVR